MTNLSLDNYDVTSPVLSTSFVGVVVGVVVVVVGVVVVVVVGVVVVVVVGVVVVVVVRVVVVVLEDGSLTSHK